MSSLHDSEINLKNFKNKCKIIKKHNIKPHTIVNIETQIQIIVQFTKKKKKKKKISSNIMNIKIIKYQIKFK